MRFLAVALTCILAGCTSPSLEASLREDASKRSSADCGEKQRKCEFAVSQMRSGEWGVTVTPVILGTDGKRVWVPGGRLHYWYSAEGKFIREMPDL
jgi:hypothetical protein